MGAVNSKVKALAIELIIRSYHIGINVQITSGLRTYAEQTKLYNQGRTTAGNIVTNAKAGQSIHNFGLAIDYVLVSEDGNKAFWDINRNMNGNQVRDWFEVATIGKSLGFSWGGDWKSFKDYPHLDMQRGYSLASLRAGKRPAIPNVPKRSYKGVGDSGPSVAKIQQDLTKAGLKCSADGFFGDGTKKIVELFQRANGLAVDGFYGESSEKKMAAILSTTNKPVPKPKPPVIKPAEKQKEDDELDKELIVIHSEKDYITAQKLSIRNNIKVIERRAVKGKMAKTVYIVGGSEKGIGGVADRFINLSGKTWEDTVQKVEDYLKKN